MAQIKQEDWSYSLPKFEQPPASVGIGLDGTCLLMTEDGWREAMVGTLAFFDKSGERQHTVYLAATPEYGKAKFLARMEAEIGRAKLKFPEARYIGIADGAGGNWDFLGRHTTCRWWTSGMRRNTWARRRWSCTGASPGPGRRGWTMRAIG